jgi:hypothetical protein
LILDQGLSDKVNLAKSKFNNKTNICIEVHVHTYLTFSKEGGNISKMGGLPFIRLDNVSIADSFYYVKYGSSIITSKIPSKVLSNENKKNWCSQ